MPDERPWVVVADPIDSEALDRLAMGPCRVADATAGASALTPHLENAWGLVVRSRTKVTADLLARAPKLRVVARAGVGVDNIDVTAATARKVRVLNTPTAATASVAELTIALFLVLARELYPQIAATKSGEWKRGQNREELEGKTVGFVGYGRIAREVARRLEPFGVRSVAYDPFVPRPVDATELLPLDELLTRSDFVSLHAALTQENHHLLNAGRIALMKSGAYLVNVARGALVDEGALLTALDSGRLAGAALDVFEAEPPTNVQLLHHPRVIATPHIGAATREAQSRAGAQVVNEILKALRGEELTALVNPEVEAER